MSEQNRTQKGKPPVSEPGMTEIPQISPRCPHCGRALPGMNILTMELPTPQGGMTWLLPSCPFIAGEDGKAADGGEPCGRVIGTQFVGYSAPKIARPGAGGWPI